MGTEEGSRADSSGCFYPSDEEIEKWMDSAFDMVSDKCSQYISPSLNIHSFTHT